MRLNPFCLQPGARAARRAFARGLTRVFPAGALFAALVAGGAVGVGGCSTCAPGAGERDRAAGGAADAPAMVRAPVPAPEGLFAEVFVATPNASWGKLQRSVGGALGILPMTLGGLVTTGLGLDPALGAEIDGAAPLVAVLADGGEGEAPAWALAVRLVDARHARDVLFDAERARYVARVEDGMTVLAPKSGTMPCAAAIASGGFLVVARTSADLARLGPYAHRTLPTRPPPTDGTLAVDVPGAALRGPLRARLAGAWKALRADLAGKADAARAAHGGRAADFGDPQALLAWLDGVVDERLAIVGDLERAHLAADLEESSLRVDVTLTPGASGAARAALASARPGDASPLLDSADSPLAVLVRDDAAGRAETARALDAAAKRALGAHLADKDEARVRAALDAWAAARQEWTALGLVGTDAFYARAPVTSADAADRAIKEGLDLLGAQPFKDALRVREVRAQAGRASIAYGEAGGGARDAGAARGEAKKAELTWTVKNGELTVLLAGAGGARAADKTLGDEPPVAAAVRALGVDASFAAVVQPLMLDPARASLPAAPLVVAWGKRDDAGWARADVSYALVRELVRARAGF